MHLEEEKLIDTNNRPIGYTIGSFWREDVTYVATLTQLLKFNDKSNKAFEKTAISQSHEFLPLLSQN